MRRQLHACYSQLGTFLNHKPMNYLNGIIFLRWMLDDKFPSEIIWFNEFVCRHVHPEARYYVHSKTHTRNNNPSLT
jgi:hypothetical protein